MATSTQSRARKTVTPHVTVTKFTDSRHSFTVLRDSSLKEYAPITTADYVAQGWDTPLRDSVARFVSHLDELRAPDSVVIGLLVDESGSMSGNDAAVIQGVNDFVAGMAAVKKIDPATAGTVLAVITTDGLENASREISAPALQKILADREADGYTFIFLGANIDAWGTGASLGFSGGLRGQTVSYASTPTGTTNAMANVTTDSSSYLANQNVYLAGTSAKGTMRSVMEDGTETTANINATPPISSYFPSGPPSTPADPSSPYADVTDALKKARGTTES